MQPEQVAHLVRAESAAAYQQISIARPPLLAFSRCPDETRCELLQPVAKPARYYERAVEGQAFRTEEARVSIIRMFRIGLFIGAGMVLSAGQAFASLCPAIGANPAGCGEVITFGPGGAVSTSTTIGPYDSADDTSVGVINNSGSPISSFSLTSTLDIFGFDADGIDGYGGDGIVGNALDAASAAEAGQCGSAPGYVNCYGGPNAYATNVNASKTSGVINFIVPIPDGGTDYFSLEEAVQLTAAGVGPPGGGTVPAPEPASFALLVSACFGLGVMRRLRT